MNLYDEALQKLLRCEAREYVPMFEAGQVGGEKENELKDGCGEVGSTQWVGV